jgi:hypothetical protein
MADELNVDLYDPVNAEALLWRGDKTGIFPVCLITISQSPYHPIASKTCAFSRNLECLVAAARRGEILEWCGAPSKKTNRKNGNTARRDRKCTRAGTSTPPPALLFESDLKFALKN